MNILTFFQVLKKNKDTQYTGSAVNYALYSRFKSIRVLIYHGDRNLDANLTMYSYSKVVTRVE